MAPGASPPAFRQAMIDFDLDFYSCHFVHNPEHLQTEIRDTDNGPMLVVLEQGSVRPMRILGMRRIMCFLAGRQPRI